MAGERDRFGCFLAPALRARYSPSQCLVFEAKCAEFSMPSSYGLATVIRKRTSSYSAAHTASLALKAWSSLLVSYTR